MFQLNRFLTLLISWLIRKRSLGLRIMRIGSICLLTSFGIGGVLDISLPLQDGQLTVSFDSASETPSIVLYLTVFTGFTLLVIGLIVVIFEQRSQSKKKVIVIEIRGLRDGNGASIMDAIPNHLAGYRDHVLYDLRQGIKDGEIVIPSTAIDQLVYIPADINRRSNGLDHKDLSIVYGGLAPVPLTFLTGVLIDDESTVLTLDWDRHSGNWRELDGVDDKIRFRVVGFENEKTRVSPEVALAISVSYKVHEHDVISRVGKLPLIQLKLDKGSSDSHWSEQKQNALGKQFLSTAIKLANCGVKRIHLFLAAQNSLVFRFGRLYDKRNLPEVVVYQYIRSNDIPHKWGILMPVCGVDRPMLIE
ncbi:MAG: SAVED domain-containing protein [Gemmatimonadota bacterium]|nr:SAVED domain-containing protein [Gemmatimonadota bacterium]